MFRHGLIFVLLFFTAAIIRADLTDQEIEAQLSELYRKRKQKKVKPVWASKPEDKAEFRFLPEAGNFDWNEGNYGNNNYAYYGGGSPWNYGNKPQENENPNGYNPSKGEVGSTQGFPNRPTDNNQIRPGVTQPSNPLNPAYPQKPTDNELQPGFPQQPPIDQRPTRPGYPQRPPNNFGQTGYPQPGYPQQPQQPTYPQQPPTEYPQQPSQPGYPQNQLGYPTQRPPNNQGQTSFPSQQPQPGYPQQPGTVQKPYPEYPETSYPSQRPQPGYPQKPQPSYPEQPQPGFPQQPQRPLPSYPQQPESSQQPQPGFPQNPQPGYPLQPGSSETGYPQQPESPQRPKPGYPQQPEFPSQRPQPGFPSQKPNPEYPQQPEYPSQRPHPGYPQQPKPGFPSPKPQPGYPEQPEFPSQRPQPEFPSQRPQPSYPQQPEFPSQRPQPGYPQQPQPGYPSQKPQPGSGSQQPLRPGLPQPGYPGSPQKPQPGYPQPGFPQRPPPSEVLPGSPFYPQIQPPIMPGELGETTGEGGQITTGGTPDVNATLVSMEELRKYCKAPRGQFGTDRSCSRFINCWDDVIVEQECGGNLLFNEDKKYCDYPDNVDCTGREITKPFVSPDGNCQSSFGAFRSKNNCGEFFICVHGAPNRFLCPGGLAYNDELGVCDYPYRVECNGVPLIPMEEVPDELDYQSGAINGGDNSYPNNPEGSQYGDGNKLPGGY